MVKKGYLRLAADANLVNAYPYKDVHINMVIYAKVKPENASPSVHASEDKWVLPGPPRATASTGAQTHTKWSLYRSRTMDGSM